MSIASLHKPIVLMAPTASGKTELALFLAKKTGGQIISADSRQVYKHLCVGTAKPAGFWADGVYHTDGVPYHLVDFLEATDAFNAGDFTARARALLTKAPHTPFIFAGGTGLYLQSLFVGMDDLPPGTPQTRAQLTDLLKRDGKEGLHTELTRVDPISAAQIPIGNVQRTMRALEIFLLTNRPASELRTGKFNGELPSDKATFVYLAWDKEMLNARIQARTHDMFEGMAAETLALLHSGVPTDVPALKSLGYPQIIDFLQGRATKEETIERIIILTRQYAKRQRTWFNRYKNACILPFSKKEDFDLESLEDKILTWKP